MFSSLVLALVLAADAPATSAPVEVQPAATPSAPAAEKQICRRVPELGSRIRAQRVCMTSKQWDEQRQQNRMTINRAQGRSANCNGGGC